MKKIFILVIILALTTCVYAQKKWTTNWAVGPHLAMSFPQSDFADITRNGEGLGAKIFYRVDRLPYFLPRLDITYLSFGEKRNSYNSSLNPYYSYTTTRTESFQVMVGPQFATKMGRFTLYCAPMGGLMYFSTLETLPIYNAYGYGNYYYQDKKFSLTRLGWAINTGFMFDLGLGPLIDFQLKYQNINNAVKHTVNGIETQSDVTDLGVSVGVVFFINKERKRRY